MSALGRTRNVETSYFACGLLPSSYTITGDATCTNPHYLWESADSTPIMLVQTVCRLGRARAGAGGGKGEIFSASMSPSFAF